jgi:SpoVK/Ycf46/Vps4 family AAA+-type ATPase
MDEVMKVVKPHGTAIPIAGLSLSPKVRQQLEGVVDTIRTIDPFGGAMKMLLSGSPADSAATAQAVAHDVGRELYRIDLKAVVSKYIGETEKNVDSIFESADPDRAILFFDQADSLFGKRSEVKDSHDRYASAEVSYLLQRLNLFPGAAIFAARPPLNPPPEGLFRYVVTLPAKPKK